MLAQRSSFSTILLLYEHTHPLTCGLLLLASLLSQVRELLSFYQFAGDDVPIVRGSALAAVEGKTPEIGREGELPRVASYLDGFWRARRPRSGAKLSCVNNIVHLLGWVCQARHGCRFAYYA